MTPETSRITPLRSLKRRPNVPGGHSLPLRTIAAASILKIIYQTFAVRQILTRHRCSRAHTCVIRRYCNRPVSVRLRPKLVTNHGRPMRICHDA